MIRILIVAILFLTLAVGCVTVVERDQDTIDGLKDVRSSVADLFGATVADMEKAKAENRPPTDQEIEDAKRDGQVIDIELDALLTHEEAKKESGK